MENNTISLIIKIIKKFITVLNNAVVLKYLFVIKKAVINYCELKLIK